MANNVCEIVSCPIEVKQAFSIEMKFFSNTHIDQYKIFQQMKALSVYIRNERGAIFDFRRRAAPL